MIHKVYERLDTRGSRRGDSNLTPLYEYMYSQFQSHELKTGSYCTSFFGEKIIFLILILNNIMIWFDVVTSVLAFIFRLFSFLSKSKYFFFLQQK